MLATRLKTESNRKQISKKIREDFKESQVDWASLAALPTNWRLRKPHPPAAPADPKLDCPKSKIESCVQPTCHFISLCGLYVCGLKVAFPHRANPCNKCVCQFLLREWHHVTNLCLFSTIRAPPCNKFNLMHQNGEDGHTYLCNKLSLTLQERRKSM